MKQQNTAIQLYKQQASPELQRKIDAQRFQAVMEQRAPAEASVPQFLAHLEFIHHHGSTIYDKDFHMIPTRSKDRKGNWVTSFESVASIHWFRKRAYEHPDYAGRIGPEFGLVHENGKIDWLPAWPFPELPLLARFGVVVKKLHEVVWTYCNWDECARKKRDGTLMQQWAEQPLWMFSKVVEVRGWRAALPNAFGNTHSDDEIASDYQVTVSEQDEAPARPNPQPTQAPIQSEQVEDTVEAEVVDSEVEQIEEFEPEEAPPKRDGKTLPPTETLPGNLSDEEQARRDALYECIKAGVLKHHSYSTGTVRWIDVRAACSMIDPPFPCGSTRPKWSEGTLDQYEQLADLYTSFDEVPYERPEGFESSSSSQDGKTEQESELAAASGADRRKAAW